MEEDRSEQSLESLQSEEIEIEELRTMTSPERWPRIYMILERIRQRIKRKEEELGIDRDKAA